jgi:hypothetical protein
MVGGISDSARSITSVSSQSERFNGNSLEPENAEITSARLLMLFEEGNWMVVER